MISNIKIEIKWVFIYVICIFIWMILERVSGLHSTRIHLQQYITMFFLIPAFFVYFFALKNKKQSYYNGTINFLQAFKSGMIITGFITLLSPITQWVISYIITPDYFKNVIAYCLKISYYKTYEQAQAQFNFNNYAIQSTFGALVIGIVFSLIIALLLKSKKQ